MDNWKTLFLLGSWKRTNHSVDPRSFGTHSNFQRSTLDPWLPVARFDANVHDDGVAYGGKPPAMGFFAPRDNFGATLQAATATSPS